MSDGLAELPPARIRNRVNRRIAPHRQIAKTITVQVRHEELAGHIKDALVLLSSKSAPSVVPEKDDPAVESVQEDDVRRAVAVQVRSVDVPGARHLRGRKSRQPEI